MVADRLSVEISGVAMRNPTMLAAGILGISHSTLRRVAEAGVGAVVTKSFGLEPRVGYSNPTVVQVEGGLVNAMGLPNPGIQNFVREMQPAQDLGVPLVVSVYAFSAEEFADVAEEALLAGPAALELNVSCPHADRTGVEVGQDPDTLKEVVRATKKRVGVPVLVKLSPCVNDIAKLARVAEEAGADAVAAINTVKAMVINIDSARPILANKFGGLSGSAVKPIAVRCVYEIYETVGVPVVGCGGISSWQDAVEFIQAGASAVQIGTAISTEGLGVFGKITKGIETYLIEKGFSSVEEIVGLSHRE